MKLREWMRLGFNTDQGVQFTSAGFLEELESRGIRVSMDGRGRFLDNIFIERLWPVDNASALKGCGVAHRLVGTGLKRELTYVE